MKNNLFEETARGSWPAHLGWVVAIASLTLTLAACTAAQQETEQTAETAPQDVAVADVVEEVDEAMDAIEVYAYENKDDFETWSRERLDAIDGQLDDLRAEIGGLSDDARTRWDETLRDLEDQREALDAEFDETLESTEEGWLEMQTRFAGAQEELSTAIDRAASELSDDEAGEQDQ